MKLRIKSTHTTLLVLGIYQVIGAVLGYYVIASVLLHTGEINGALLLIFLIAIGLYSLSLKAGSLLIRKEYKRGLVFSLVTQILQIISIGVGGYNYSFCSGSRLAAGFNFTDGFLFKFDLALTSRFNLSWNNGEELFFFVNLLAVFLVYIISDIYDEMFKKKQTVREPEIEDAPELKPEESAEEDLQDVP